MDRITAVLGVYKNLDLTKEFLLDMKTRFPKVPLAIGMLGNPSEYQEDLEKWVKKNGINATLIGGKVKNVPFSMNWNSAINAIKTERFVFLHNDMYLHDKFFEELTKDLYFTGPGYFRLYTTIEPLENQGFTRPGKIVAPFGHNREEFDLERFNAYVEKIFTKDHPTVFGYGFYLAGYTDDLKKVGGFDHKTFNTVFCEDDDINIRIRLAGFKVVVSPRAVAYHFGSKTVRLLTEKSMSDLEIESNRKFSRKWGFEARFLWSTGYETSEDLWIGTEKILFRFGEGYNPTFMDVANTEPLVDYIEFDPKKLDMGKYFDDADLSKKLLREEYDIMITQTGPAEFSRLAYLIGALRFQRKHLKPGTVLVGPYLVDVFNVRPESRVDQENYLSLVKGKSYEIK